MPRNQLRTSGIFQASLIALALAVMLGSTPPGTDTKLWPFLLGGYGFLAALVPWLIGGLSKAELSFGYSAFLGAAFAVPMAVAATWLEPSAYRSIAMGCWILAIFWLLHLLTAVFIRLAGARLS